MTVNHEKTFESIIGQMQRFMSDAEEYQQLIDSMSSIIMNLDQTISEFEKSNHLKELIGQAKVINEISRELKKHKEEDIVRILTPMVEKTVRKEREATDLKIKEVKSDVQTLSQKVKSGQDQILREMNVLKDLLQVTVLKPEAPKVEREEIQVVIDPQHPAKDQIEAFKSAYDRKITALEQEVEKLRKPESNRNPFKNLAKVAPLSDDDLPF